MRPSQSKIRCRESSSVHPVFLFLPLLIPTYPQIRFRIRTPSLISILYPSMESLSRHVHPGRRAKITINRWPRLFARSVTRPVWSIRLGQLRQAPRQIMFMLRQANVWIYFLIYTGSANYGQHFFILLWLNENLIPWYFYLFEFQ